MYTFVFIICCMYFLEIDAGPRKQVCDFLVIHQKQIFILWSAFIFQKQDRFVFFTIQLKLNNDVKCVEII